MQSKFRNFIGNYMKLCIIFYKLKIKIKIKIKIKYS